SALSPPLCAVLSRLAEQREQVVVLPAGAAQLACERARGGIAARDCCRWGILALPNRLAHHHAPAAAAGRERRPLHEERRKCRRHVDIGHDVVAVFPAPLVRQTCTGRTRPRLRSSTVPTRRLNHTPRISIRNCAAAHPLDSSIYSSLIAPCSR